MNEYFYPFEVSEETLRNCSQVLSNHTDAANNGTAFLKGIRALYSGDYSGLSLKRSLLKDCKCESANFNSAAFTGSQFQGVTFTNCNFANAAVDFSLLYGCKILSDEGEIALLNSNFSNTNLISCILSDVAIHKSVLSNSLFKDTTFSKCSIQYSSFENTTFQHCHFFNMELCDLNLDFSEFLYSSFENVILPFSQIPYTFGLLQTLRELRQEIWVSSKKYGKISLGEYFDLFPQLICYYIAQREYFPLANIYMAQNHYDMAYQAILSGIKKSGFEKDFRMLKYFCKLARLSGQYDQKAMNLLYDYIYDHRHFEPMKPFEQRNYYFYLGEIRNILLVDDSNSPTLYFRIQSNILPDDKENLVLLLQSVDLIVKDMPSPIVYKTELRHSSPYEILIVAIGALMVLKLLAECLSSICKPVKDIQDIHINNQTIKLNQQKLELEKQELLINNAKLQELEKATEKRRLILSESNISLESSHYYLNDELQTR